MGSRVGRCLFLIAAVMIHDSGRALADEQQLAGQLRAIRAVAAEGRGNQEAARAIKGLTQSPARAIPAILAGFDGANPLAANYLRSAVEAIAQRELKAGKTLPVKELEAFIRDTKHDPRGRRLGFELLAGVDPTATERLIPGMLEDPGTEFRRDAVARFIDEGKKLLAAEKPADARPIFSKALAAARDDDQVQALKKALEGLGEKVDLQRHFGFVPQWRLVAPFDNSAGKGLAAVYPPEMSIDPTAEYAGKEEKKIGWVAHATDNEYGIVDLAKVLGPFKGSVAYAVAEFESDEPRAVDLRLGTPNSWKLWLNGALVFSREEYHRGMSLDQYKMPVKLKRGKNIILLKICQNEQTEDWAQRWQFQLRVCDGTGTAILSADRKREKPAVEASGGS